MSKKPSNPNAPQADKPGRPITFPAPPGVAAEVARLVADGMKAPAVKMHLAAEAAKLLAPLRGQVREVVGRRMGFSPPVDASDPAIEPVPAEAVE